MAKLELVSFKLCPFVQRSVITLKHKKAPFEITYIDLENPPKWFHEISPMGKVPVLKIDDRIVLFESAVINEYIDETVGTPLLPKDPLTRAFERAWIEFGSDLIMQMYHLTMETDRAKMSSMKDEFFADFSKLDKIIDQQGPYFRGKDFSLADAAYAPIFVRLFLSETLRNEPAWSRMPKVRAWGERVVELPAVRDSVVPDFAELYRRHARDEGSLLY